VTIIVTVYAIVTERAVTVAYNYWALITLDVFLLIFWLISFAKDAAEASAYNNWWLVDGTLFYTGINKTWRNALIAASVLGAFQL
jgi:hypothetical protein